MPLGKSHNPCPICKATFEAVRGRKYCSRRCCVKAAALRDKELRIASPEVARARDKAKREADPDGVKRRYQSWRERDPDKAKALRAKACAAHRERHPDRTRARAETREALRIGIITRQPCEVCGDPKSEAHHPDYAKPMEIKWLCRTHHHQEHKELKNA